MTPSALDLTTSFEPELMAIFGALDFPSPPVPPPPVAPKLPILQARVNSAFQLVTKRAKQLDEDNEVASITSQPFKKQSIRLAPKQPVQRPTTPPPPDAAPDLSN